MMWYCVVGNGKVRFWGGGRKSGEGQWDDGKCESRMGGSEVKFRGHLIENHERTGRQWRIAVLKYH
jgi:hypothetical protein